MDEERGGIKRPDLPGGCDSNGLKRHIKCALFLMHLHIPCVRDMSNRLLDSFPNARTAHP